VLGVSRSVFHGWERPAPSDRVLSDGWLIERIKKIHELPAVCTDFAA
jgi:hypothetical protein